MSVTALLVAVAVVSVLLLSSNSTTRYVLRFENAGQLVKGNDVQVGGRRVGSVTDIRLSDDGQADVTVQVDEEFAPLHAGTTAIIRQTSLSGIANRYIALAPGPDTAAELDEGATLPATATTSPVDLDQLFATLDAPTRRALQQVIRGSATQYEGRGPEANASAQALAPALSSTSALAEELTRDDGALQGFLVESARTVTALAARRDDLSRLVADGGTALGAIADERAALGEAVGELPTTLRRGSATFAALRQALGDVDALVDASKPATKDLAPFLRELRPLVDDARPTIADLRTLVRAPGRGNDLTDLVRQAPRLQATAAPALRHGLQALQQATPVLTFARPYTPELVGWLRDFGQSASNYDANGHFARIQPAFNAFQVTDNPIAPILTPIDASQRLDGIDFGNTRRCPGAATQPEPGGSNPFRPFGLDCDPNQLVPGP